MNVGAAAAAAAAEAIEHVLGPRSARNEAGVGRVVGQLLRRRLLPANACADLLESHSLARVCAALQQAGPEIEHADASLLCRLLERLRAALVDQQEPERPAAEAEPTARARMSGALRHAIEEVLALNRRHWQRKRGVVSATAQDAPPPTRGQVHQEAARELGLTLVAVETPREKLRGLREGWVYWYVGAPVIHPGTGENYVYNQLSQRFEPKTADDVTCRSSFACARG
uniref:Uncharacterized protein n=1 Tax=Chrysotila carterae TaxID=13221 RepID=A0A7S4BUU2_CHRCT